MTFSEFLFRVLRGAAVLVGALMVLLVLSGVALWVALIAGLAVAGRGLLTKATMSRGGR